MPMPMKLTLTMTWTMTLNLTMTLTMTLTEEMILTMLILGSTIQYIESNVSLDVAPP